MSIQEVKPADCTCEWPAIRVRNMVGHPPSCPVYARWMRENRPAEPAQDASPGGGEQLFARPVRIEGPTANVQSGVQAPMPTTRIVDANGQHMGWIRVEFAEEVVRRLNGRKARK